MHILPAFFTTTKVRRHKAKSVSDQPSKHDIWLRKNGVHPDQIKMKKGVDKNWKKRYNGDVWFHRRYRET
jgi:hypothetical protein